jgi:single-strand DNA-binding protein
MIDKNRFEITGNLVAAPELRYTPKGTPVAHARIIHTDSHKDSESGEWKKGKPMGIDFVIWGASAEAFVKKVSKGTAVFLEGRMKPNEFTGRDGTQYYGLRLRVDQWHIIAHPRAKEEAGNNGQTEQGTQPKGRGSRKSTAANG